MNENLINLLQLSMYFLLLFGMAELLYRFVKVNVEYTRKFVHIGTGLLTMLFPIMFNHYIWVIFICSTFYVILTISIKLGLLPSINAIKRVSHGSLSYPVIVTLVYVFYYYKTSGSSKEYLYFYIPILTMALADPVAAFIGSKFPAGKFSVGKEQKTISGSSAFFVIACIVSYVFLPMHDWHFVLIISVVATITEAITTKGFDNLTIPIAIAAVLYFYS